MAEPRPYMGARQARNKHAPWPVRILLEPSLQPLDYFVLEPEKTSKPPSGEVKFGPISTRLTVEKTYIVIEFEMIRDPALYRLAHVRVLGGQSERDVTVEHFLGSTLTDPGWVTPGRPPTTRPEEHHKPPQKTPPHTKDQLLRQSAVTDFAQVRVEEAKIGGKP
jgi:hypothetical protein